jgi:CheY-like chemotaxis protein/HPt (histidine-containing phosphotransfer) domain-containing protein
LIEDNVDNRKLTSAMLEKHGMLVEAFENGADAIEEFSNSEYDVILTDLEMPGMDGVQVAQKIRALEKRLHTKKTPIVAVTAHALVSFQERCLAAGMDAFVTKPVRWPELFMKLDELLTSRPKILIVDDTPDALAIAKKLLSAEGEYDIDTVQSGHDAVRSIKAQRYDLVLLDMLMPDLNGADTIKQIKAHHKDLSVLAMTSLDRSELSRLSTLFDGQIQKPLQRGEFTEIVKQHLRHRRDRQVSPARTPGDPANKKQSVDKRYVVEIDPDILKLIPSFLESRSKDVTTLRESLGSGDLEVARRIGHTLKGVGASYGFPEITVFGQKIERAVLDGRLKEAREQINQLETYLNSVVVQPAE